MAECLKFTRPIVRRGASLYADQARWQLLKERQNVATLQLAADDHLASGVNSVNLEDRLGDVETDCCDACMASSSESWESLNNAHIHGTHVRVEEPSTASTADKRRPEPARPMRPVCPIGHPSHGTALYDLRRRFSALSIPRF
jgi:hypothetical protein